MRNILVTLPPKARYKAMLEAAAPDGVFRYRPLPEVTAEEVQWADIILGNVPPRLIQGSPRLKLLQLNSAGTDGFLEPGVLDGGTLLCNASGAYGLAISEHMLGMLLMLLKRLHHYRDNQRERLWRDEGNVTSIDGCTALTVGLGDIGGEFARKMKALGAHTMGVRRSDRQKPDYLDELVPLEDLDRALPRADVVALSLPDTPETYRLFDRERIGRCKDGAILLNVGRGTAVDTDALCDALESGKLGGAGVDVTDPEPLPADHRLWGMENAVITPHVSGFFHLEETLHRIVERAAENLRRFLAGKELLSQVDAQTGYRRLP